MEQEGERMIKLDYVRNDKTSAMGVRISENAIDNMEKMAQIEFDVLKETYKDIDEGVMQDMFERLMMVGYENGYWDRDNWNKKL